MKLNSVWRTRLSQILFGCVIVFALVVVRGIHAGDEPVHLTTDWSHHHVVFSAPHSLWEHIRFLSNPRYVQQLVRRSGENKGIGDSWRWSRAPESPDLMNGDWSTIMGSGATLGAGNYPAKFSFNASTANCSTATQPDYVVYNTSLAPLATGTDATRNGTFTGLSTNSNATSATTSTQTVTIGGSLVLYSNTGASSTASGTVTVTGRPFNADTVTIGPVNSATTYVFVNGLGGGTKDVIIGTTAATAAQNLEAAINDNSSQCATTAPCFDTGITAANGAGTATLVGTAVTITAPAAGAANNFWMASSSSARDPLTGTPATGGAGSNTGLNFLAVTNVTTTATNLAAAIARNGGGVGVTATSSAGVDTVTATTAGTAGNSITLAEGLTNFTWAGATLTGAINAQANIVAFDNLYSGCTGTVPSPYWAYDTGGTVVTSPTLSGDGTQVAFVQTVGGVANLVLLKWAASGTATYATPVVLTTQASAAAYQTCTAPCMYTIAFNGGAADTTSSPFYDFSTDTIFVGDSAGKLHQFTTVFKGAPAEVTTTWPVLAASAPLSSPVYDDGTGYVYVASSFQQSNDSGSRLHAVCATATCGTVGTVIASGIMGPTASGSNCSGAGGTSGDTVNLLLDSPVLDPSNNTIYVEVGNDGTGKSAIYQFSSGYATQTCGHEVTLGTGSTTGVPVYAGNFDNLYYTGSAGHFYVCGNAGGDSTLYQVTAPATGVFTAGAATAGPVLTTATTTCGPVVEVDNPNASGGAKDWIFTSVQNSAVTAGVINCGASSGCIMSFDVTSGAAISAATTTVGHTTVAGGASGVVVDNTVSTGTLAGASQVYFTPLANQTCTTSGGTGGCAIQASQSALN